MKLKIFTDGGSRGNPGQAAVGVVIYSQQDSKVLAEISKCIGVATNNVAEYTAVWEALRWVEANVGQSEMDFILDSELVVRQLSGFYKVKDPNLKVLHNIITDKLTELGGQSTFTAVKREGNKKADALVNHALDGLKK